MSSPRGLHALARLHGIQTAYHDHAGRRVGASTDALLATLRALGGVRDAADIAPALARRRRTLWERVVEPVVVAWLPNPSPFTLRLPDRLRSARVRVAVALEDGGERTSTRPVEELEPVEQVELGGRAYTAYAVDLPAVPAGYHDLHVTVEGSGAPVRHTALLLAAPERCAGWEVLPGSPDWGVFAPLHALYGAGEPHRLPDFSLLDRLAEPVAELGGSVVGTLPLLATFLDRPYEPSPYMPVSTLFWNELYVADPDAAIGNGDSVDDRRIDYPRALTERRERLASAARTFFREHTLLETREADASREGTGLLDLVRAELRTPELAAFMARNPTAMDYARFRALTERHGAWSHWPDRLRARDVRPGDYDPELARYHLFAQWQAERQMAEVEERAASRGVSLYLDLPLGVHPHGYDTWRERDQFVLDATVGAPPDPLAPDGQEWGFHPPHPETARLDRHRYFIAAIRKHLRFARVLRIDHVMRLHRLFWVPDGDARHGVYVRYPHHELFAILSLESHRKGAVIVGEDLGTVPRRVRRSMREHGMPGMYVAQFELREDAKGAEGAALVPKRVPEGTLASIGTHDTPTFAGWWTGRDAEVRAERGLVDPAEAEAQVAGRADLREKLSRGGGETEIEFEIEFEFEVAEGSGAASLLRDPVERRKALAAQAALYRALGRSEAGLVLASLEDLWLETEPQNVPGTPAVENWRRRARRPVEAITEGAPAGLLTALNAAREGRR
jgi:4-alpha-glucanotransferase